MTGWPSWWLFDSPEDAVNSTGAPFWSAPKRFPHPLKFDAEDAWQSVFVQVCLIGNDCLGEMTLGAP
jgi:hypothetical protein